MENVFLNIKKRYSVRTYEPIPIPSDIAEPLKAFLEANKEGPFGNPVRFSLIQAAKDSEKELKNFISYGNVKGARAFIAGAVATGDHAMEDFGYCMEKNILYATSLGLGTVWLGGSLNRSSFARQMQASQNEVIPAITPVGYAAEKRSTMDKLLRTLSGGKNRKDFREVFFEGALSKPLDKAACGKYADVLEAVRLAPSASNKQPWRIVKETGKNTFHLYLEEHFSNKAIKDIRIQNNDMGIAMCHFELTAQELGLQGMWQVEQPDLKTGSLAYIVSWIG